MTTDAWLLVTNVMSGTILIVLSCKKHLARLFFVQPASPSMENQSLFPVLYTMKKGTVIVKSYDFLPILEINSSSNLLLD